MKPYEHQEDISTQAYEILKTHGLVYLAMEERTGKTLTSILICEKSPVIKNVLVITKKKALDGWFDTLKAYTSKTKNYVVVNYHQVSKVDSSNFDLVIIDEAHAYLSKYPKVGAIWKDVAKHTKGKPIIYLSATPNAQSYSMLYHQFKLSDWSPWRHYSNFYKWFEVYGLPRTRFIGGKQFKEYHNTKEEYIKKDIDDLFISYSRKELGFKHEPNDVIHFIDLSDDTKAKYKQLEETNVLTLPKYQCYKCGGHNINLDTLECDGDIMGYCEDCKFTVMLFDESLTIIADTPMSCLTKLHQIEGGTIKFEDNSYFLDNTEKIAYIKSTWGDTSDMVIFYHYVHEELLLRKHFTNARILQAISYAEGVDLSMYKHSIMYSFNFSTSQYTQRRARQANMKREEEINVNFLLVRGGISEQVYTTVAVNKKNFVDKYYTRGLL